MKHPKDTATPSAPDEAALFLALAEKQIHLTDALDVCAHIGKILQQSDHLEKKAAIAALRYEASNFIQKRDLTAAVMLTQLANAWEDS